MKKLLILIGVIASTQAAFGQAATKTAEKMKQEGEQNEINLKINSSDTLAGKTTIISQKGTNLIVIETNTTTDSLGRVLENLSVDQQGKQNKVSIESERGNTVQIRQSGNGNTVMINQKSNR